MLCVRFFTAVFYLINHR